MTDIVNQINATHRELGHQPVASGEGRSVLLRRVYDAPVEDVWSACTDPERLARWLGPVEGDFRVGGTFQLKDNAGGEILRCEEPRLIKVTWVFGEGMPTEVEVRLAAQPTAAGADRTVLELEHSSPAAVVDELVRTYGTGGTIGIGCGWDLALQGLHLFLGRVPFDPATWGTTPEGRQFSVASCHAWAEAIRPVWAVTDADIAFAVQHFAPEGGR